MNVYSIRFLPKIKLKICEFLGVASDLAFKELSNRLHQIELRMDRFEAQLRRIHRRQMALESAKAKTIAKPQKNTKTKRVEPPKALSAAKTTGTQKDNTPKTPEKTVLLVQPDGETLQAIQSYFGTEAQVLALDEVAQVKEAMVGREVAAVFFERTLLGNPDERRFLEEMGAAHPHTKFVGLSNYLSLAISQVAPGLKDFSDFLTRPLNKENLAGVFEEKERQVIS